MRYVVYFLSRDLYHTYDEIAVDEINPLELKNRFEKAYPHIGDRYEIRYKDKNAVNLEERIKFRTVDKL